MLPANTSLQKDAVLALTKSATVFISYLAATANEQRPSAKTVTPQDVLKALQEMELEKVMGLGERNEDGSVGGRLERELAVFEEVVRGKRKGYRDKVKARESGVSGVEEGEEGDGERVAKRARRASEGEGEGEGDEEQDEEDALLDAQLNGPNGGMEEEHEEDHEDEDEGDDPEDEQDEDDTQQQRDEDEMEDSIDVDDGHGHGRRTGSGSGPRSSILSPNGRAEVGSDGDDSD